MSDVKLDSSMLHRSLNMGFSGGEKKKNEILQMKFLKPKMIILDELDSGLDVDAIKTVSNGIKFRYEVSLEDSVFLSDIDKCALLGNLLDNAMEGTMKAEGKKVVDLRINCAKGLFVVQIRNTYNGKLKDGLKTSKYDSLNHGFGLASVREVIERNHGTIKVNAESTEAIQECTDPIFEVFIVIPMKETN